MDGLSLEARLNFGLELYAELLRRFAIAFSHRADLADPTVFVRLLFLEDKHDVAGHAFLSNEHFLIAIDDEVATLVVAALLGVVDDLRLVEVGQVAELGADHDGDLSNLDLVVKEYRLLVRNWLNTGFGVLGAILDLLNLHCDVNLCLVGQPADPGLVGQDGLVAAVSLVHAGELVDCRVSKYNLVGGLLVIGSVVVSFLLNCDYAELLNDFLN